MQRSMTGARLKSCVLKILWAIVIIAPAPLTRAYGQDSPPGLPVKPVMPTFSQHFKAGPYPIMPISDPARDSAKTSGFSVLDLYAGAQLYDRVSMTAGIDNVFDKRYAVHHVVPLTGTGAAKGVDAPGRTFFVRATASF